LFIRVEIGLICIGGSAATSNPNGDEQDPDRHCSNGNHDNGDHTILNLRRAGFWRAGRQRQSCVHDLLSPQPICLLPADGDLDTL
jgi:hypothetical protein